MVLEGTQFASETDVGNMCQKNECLLLKFYVVSERKILVSERKILHSVWD